MSLKLISIQCRKKQYNSNKPVHCWGGLREDKRPARTELEMSRHLVTVTDTNVQKMAQHSKLKKKKTP